MIVFHSYAVAIITIARLLEDLRNGPVVAEVHAQVETLAKKNSSGGKPYYELRLRDGGGTLLLRAWSETPAYEVCQHLTPGEFVSVSGEFLLNGTYGPDARRWELRTLSDEERIAVLEGDEEQRRIRSETMAFVRSTIEGLQDPRLRALGILFLEEQGERFARAAAARQNHHARRGGLLEHTAQMMRSAQGVCAAYPELNRDLILAAILFHDAGKLWETCPPESGFGIGYHLSGELLGHICIGIELVNAMWRRLPLEDWKDVVPPSEEVRLHLLHIIASHHGELEFGSPVLPKTPEAMAVHYIDNLDARMEMFRMGYRGAAEVAPGIFERPRPLASNIVRSLPSVPAQSESGKKMH